MTEREEMWAWPAFWMGVFSGQMLAPEVKGIKPVDEEHRERAFSRFLDLLADEYRFANPCDVGFKACYELFMRLFHRACEESQERASILSQCSATVDSGRQCSQRAIATSFLCGTHQRAALVSIGVVPRVKQRPRKPKKRRR